MHSLNTIAESIQNSFKRLDIFKAISTEYTVVENDKRATLQGVRFINLPKENIWRLKSEIQDTEGLECLQNENSTVEETIIFHKNGRLYLIMVELKSSLSKNQISKFKTKLMCSLVTATKTLAIQNWLSEFRDAEIIPIGIYAFNDNTFQIDLADNPHKIDRLEGLKKKVFEFDFTKNSIQETSVIIQPITMNEMRIGVFFCQNPALIKEYSDSTSFTINFNELNL